MTILPLMKERYSLRKYKEKQLPKDTLDIILEAGRVAPTACNNQTQRILIIQSDEGLAKVAKAAKTFNPPTILLICSDTTTSWKNPFDGKAMNDIDCSIVSTHMMLEAKAQGVDSLWLNWFDPNILREEFNIPDNYEIVNLLALGYPDKEPPSPDRHKTTRKPLKETVFFEKY